MPVLVRLLAVALWLVPCAALAQNKTDLKPKFAAGTEARYQITLEDSTRVSTSVGGPTEMNHRELTVAIKCLRADAGGVALELKFERIVVKFSRDEKARGFDSAKPAQEDESPFGQAFRPLVGVPLSLSVDSAGQITKVSGSEKVAPSGPLANDVATFTTKESLQALLAPVLTLTRPAGEAAAGATWNVKETVTDQRIGELTITTEFRLADAAAGRARIAIGGEFGLKPAKGAEGLTLKTTSFRGEAQWDCEHGQPVELSLERGFTVEMASGGENAAMNQLNTTRWKRIE